VNSIYSFNHTTFFDRIIIKKRYEMIKLINKNLKGEVFFDALDIGTTDDMDYESSNYLIKNLEEINVFKSISDQKINSIFFLKSLNKSILDNFSADEIHQYKADIVISNATIEHVGNYKNQLKMISNIVDLTKKKFIITTPNRFHPFDFHTKIPLIHWLPKKIHRKILSIFGLKYFAREENLNLLSINDLKNLLNNFELIEYKVFYIRFFGFISNYIIIGTK
tara:strand:+ start:440 stop:1105 length:666 start_codon:yes stop_codon:yes gene_type:complete